MKNSFIPPQTVKLHPVTLKYLGEGHPWVTKDSFTEQFPEKALFLKAKLANGDEALLLHDPQHTRIKARLWQKYPKGEKLSFETPRREHILERLRAAMKRRKLYLQNESSERSHFYHCYGEADFLPGLFILQLGPVLLVQTFAFFWENIEQFQLPSLLEECFPASDIIAWQTRTAPGVSPLKLIRGTTLPSSWQVSENGLTLELRADKHDWGIYTDMAAIREKLRKPFFEQKVPGKMLNLFSYTGIFSLIGLQYGHHVTSVDLSPQYMSWLEHNISLNHFEDEKHQSIVASADVALKKFPQEHFQLIVCDPPTFFHSKKTRSTSADFYEQALPLLDAVMAPGAFIFLAINTHSLNRKKFFQHIDDILKKNHLSWKRGQDFFTHDDAPLLRNFAEGDVIKCALWQKSLIRPA
jgi:23S rRNA G2069 N7-methylase RlmK/C1962 C5-methylase RlmI